MTIEAIDLRFGFTPRHAVLDGITARAESGRVTAVVGPNAVGKTTLLRLLAGVLRPWSGGVLFLNRPLHEYPARDRAQRLAYVAQRPVVDAPFTVRDVVALGAIPHGRASDAAVVDATLARCELDDVESSRFHELSVGQQQRVSLARALVQLGGAGPGRALLLDEPMSAMDPRHVLHTGRILRDLASSGTTILIILHDLPVATALADDVWALHEAAVIAAGPIREVLTAEVLERMYRVPFTTDDGAAATMSMAARPVYDFGPATSRGGT